MITWQAGTSGEGDFRYRFRVRAPGSGLSIAHRRGSSFSGYQMIRDYGPASSLDWTAVEHEGMYEMEVSVKDMRTGDAATATQIYQFLPRAYGNQSSVNATSHPLVFLFSAPPCPPGARMRVHFRTGADAVQQTPAKDCRSGWTMNFYLAGLRAETTYAASFVLEAGTVAFAGPEVTFRSGTIPKLGWTQTAIVPAPPGATQPVLLGTSGGSQIATDLQGRVIWYNPAPFTWGTRPETGGYMWGVMEDTSKDITYQSIRAVDLTGMTVLETNAERVNEQLAAMGRRPISGFHHEVRAIPGDRIVALAGVEQLMTDMQGAGETDVMGDTIVVFDRDLNVVWAWDSFDFLDPARMSSTKDVCTGQFSACPPFYLDDTVNDWTHGNAVQYTPDGQLLVSLRHQDWLLKLDYSNGTGSGAVLWRLGRYGDFACPHQDPFPWFSHQHDANFEAANPSRLVVFDNGNLRITEIGGTVNSRGQVFELDPASRTANLVLNVDLGVMSMAVGSAQRLENGNYFFNAGFVFGKGKLEAHQFEVDPVGNIVSRMRASTGLYRSFRMRDLYSDAESR